METMIKNERQYHTTKIQAQKIQDALSRPAKPPSKRQVHPLLRKAEQDALRSQLRDLRAEIREYESLRSGDKIALARTSLDELPRTLIQARIALGLSQKDLANRLGLKEQQIQRYEATNYASASLTRVQEIARALGLRLQADAIVA
jgi:ribosome-binding protein aMBF1 (putative translation factor)